MTWAEFYRNFPDWSDSTIRTRISSLEDMGRGHEVVDAVLNLPAGKLQDQLIRKAMRMQVRFSHEDFMHLEGELSDEVYAELAAYAGFDASCPYMDENNISWREFAADHSLWSASDTLRRIGKLKDFGTSDEVFDAICGMPDAACEKALYRRARAAGVRFTEEELAYLEPPAKSTGLLGTLLAFFGLLGGSSPHDTGRCNGDCANCPPHYGYRHGRWYYGRGHQYGCQRGGNGGASGRTFLD